MAQGKAQEQAASLRTLESLPHALTLFMSAGDRARVLRVLAQTHPDRVRALKIRLGLDEVVEVERGVGGGTKAQSDKAIER